MITVEELQQRFAVRTVPPYGECVVVPGAEFDPDWEVYLGDQGYSCRFTDFDKRPVVLVHVKQVRRNASSVTDKVPENVESVKSKENKKNRKKRHRGNPRPVMPWLENKEFWTDEEDTFVMDLWRKGVSLSQVGVKVHEQFPSRSKSAGIKRVYRLQEKGLLEKRSKEKVRYTSSRYWRPEEIEFLIDKWNKGLIVTEIEAEFVEQVLGSQNDFAVALAELKADFDRQMQFIHTSLVELSADVAELKLRSTKHKHAMGSGEAVMPMEAAV